MTQGGARPINMHLLDSMCKQNGSCRNLLVLFDKPAIISNQQYKVSKVSKLNFENFNKYGSSHRPFNQFSTETSSISKADTSC